MKKLGLLLTFVFLFLRTNAQTDTGEASQTIKDYYHLETEAEVNERMTWFTDSKYGMFVHFGLYSQLGGRWEGEQVKGVAEWVQAFANIDRDVYAEHIKTFNPEKFDADALVKAAKESGMTYLVLTTKHHEGFCLWDSKFTDFDISNTPYKKDLVRQVKDACDKYGLRFGVYYSVMDWHHPSHILPRTQNRNFFTLIKYYRPRMKRKDKAAFIEYMYGQLNELVDNYDPDLVWFDGAWQAWWKRGDAERIYNYVRSLKSSVVINNRHGNHFLNYKKDYKTPEQYHPKNKNVPWEACYTLNDSWGYDMDDDNFKQADVVFKQLQEINAGGGNLLLNVGPKGDGDIPRKSLERLKEVKVLMDQSSSGN